MSSLRRRSLILLLAATRCATAPPPPPTLALTVVAAADQNPDPPGRPAPVAIRLYQLAAPGAFTRADAYALMEHATETLGPDLLATEELIVAPGEHRTVNRDIKPGTHLLGVAVLFRGIDRATWRASAAVAANGPTALSLTTTATTVTLATN